ncbi:MAG: circadian clock KaiB family protein [Methylobacter sp.]|uniref:circadian clock KaiB family protein n=1 Tax=Methylobacter sp. TaxID=2051955 RepID=UPI002716B561|nr:circadian clock KaiB family protein [Methylobacter sp.]MDO9271207.1 circadian clock KaiB family protein [Methylobacter sp.]MDP1664384.1 circadian clock KaiB family protein [Methylobacter sp.]
MKTYLMTLFVTGDSPRSERALHNLIELCDKAMPGNYSLNIIDVLEQPNLAEEEKIFATPTLIKRTPSPTRRIIGDLSDYNKVLLGLGVTNYE